MMPLTLDPQIERRIQHETELGHDANPNELISHALDRLHDDEDIWTDADRAALDALLDERVESYKRSEGIPGSQAREHLAQRPAARAA